MRARNQYGVSVVTIGYQFLVETGGRAGGSDQYITRLEIAPGQVELAWGWNADLSVVIEGPGESGVPGAMFAVLTAQLELTLHTEIKSLRVAKTHLVLPQGVLMV